MGQSGTRHGTMNTILVVSCVLAVVTGQQFQSFPSTGGQQPQRQPAAPQQQFIFDPRAQQQFQAEPAPQQFRQAPRPQLQQAPQQFRQPLNIQPAFRQPQAAPQQFRQPPQPQPVAQQFRQPDKPQPAAQQFRQPTQPQPAPQQFRHPPQPQQAAQQIRQPQQAAPQLPTGAGGPSNVGDVQIAAVEYVHDTSGDATLSRFQPFQQRKKQEAQG